MNGRSNLMTAVIVGVVGALLIAFKGRGDLLTWIAVLIGIMFIIPSVYTLCVELFSRDKARVTPLAVITSLGGLGLGIAMCIVPEVFVGIFIYLFAALLILGGIYHVVFITWLARPFRLPLWFYIVPAVLIVTGIVILCNTVDANASVIVLVTGIGFLLFAINSIMEYVATRPGREAVIKQ